MQGFKTFTVTGAAIMVVLLIGIAHDLTIAKSMTHWGLGNDGDTARWGFVMVFLAASIGGLVLLIGARIDSALRGTGAPDDEARQARHE